MARCTWLDLSKTFDTVDHSILLKKCSRYGLRGKIEELLKSYLKDRKQFVRYKRESSSTNEIECGVPQRSVLGPLLFLICINDIVDIPKHNNILLCADDTNLFGKYEQTEHINDMKLIYSWLETYKLTPNIEKTQLLLLGTNNLSAKKLIWKEEVEESKCVKYIGANIDTKLTFEVHIDYVQMKCNQYFSILYQTKKYLQGKLHLKIYKQDVIPQYQYGVLLYDTQTKVFLKVYNINKSS